VNNNVKTFQHFKTEYLKELSSNDVKEYETALLEFQQSNKNL